METSAGMLGKELSIMKKRILCFGDSNTWGYNGENGERFDEYIRWTGRLQRLLGSEYTVIEEGQNGRTTVWDDPIENRLAGLTYLWPCMESQSPFDLIIIMLGTNDTKTYFSQSPRNIAAGAARLVRTAQASAFGPDHKSPEVLLVSPIRVEFHESFDGMFGQQAAEKSLGFSEQFKIAADETGCHFLDASLYAGPGKADGVHLSPEGHEALAEALYEKVTEIL